MSEKQQNDWVDAHWGTRGVHDPTIIEADDHYYMFSTDTHVAGQATHGIQIRESTDLVQWQFVGTAFDHVPIVAANWAQATGLWAPEVIKVGDQYRMYYAASTFGSQVSCIGLATAPQPVGPWTPSDLVIKTDGGQNGQNAIDANVVTAADGRQWLLYGSFFGGIFLVELNRTTGLTKYPGDFGQRIAQRPRVAQDGAIEGCFIQYRPDQDYYYLFMSYDSLTWSYHVRVARSRQITGPYHDFNGQDVFYPQGERYQEIGTKILGSYQFANEFPWVGPGHNSILTSGDQDFMVHHVRCQPNQNDSYGMIRKVYWLENGWPVVDPNYYKSATDNHPLATSPAEIGEIICWPSTSELIPSHQIPLDSGFYANLDSYRWITSWDWEQQCAATYLVGLTKAGTGIWVKTH